LFPADLIERLSKKYKTASYQFYWESEKGIPVFHWHKAIVDRGPANKEDLYLDLVDSDNFQELDIWLLLQEVLGPSILMRCYVNAYTYGTDAMAHQDSTKPGEVTTIVYLNKDWQ